MKHLYMALGVILLWTASLMWANHRGVTSERQAQAQKAEKAVKKHKKAREKVEEQVNELPPASTVPVDSAPDGSAAAELLRDWSRD